MSPGTLRRRTYEIVTVAQPGDLPSRVFDVLLVLLIMLNVLAVNLETVESVAARWARPLFWFEIFSVMVFTLEYVLRIWSCVENPAYAGVRFGRLRFAAGPMLIIDLLAILPFYLPMVVTLDLRFLRALRLIRILRLFKLGRYSQALQTIGRVVSAKKEELLTTAFVVFILLLVASAGFYYAEHESQPEAIPSIPAALWWGVVTLSTVGYGDIVPVTFAGKLLGAAVALLGIGMFALPTGILGAAFVEELRKRRVKEDTRQCPHCGGEIR